MVASFNNLGENLTPRKSLKILKCHQRKASKMKNVGAKIQQNNLFIYDFEKCFNWSKFYPKNNVHLFLKMINEKNRMRGFSFESLNKKKISRFVRVHTRNKNMQSSDSKSSIKSIDANMALMKISKK